MNQQQQHYKDVCCSVKLRFCLCTLCRFFSLGGRLSRIIFMALSGGSLKYGGSPSTISMTMIPSDQISTWTQQEETVNEQKSIFRYSNDKEQENPEG